MTPEELKRKMRFSHPEDNVSMRNKNYRWTQPTYEIKNIRRDAEDPNNSTVYYEDMRGNKYKTNAQMFVERFGDFYIESAINHAIKLLAQVPGYDSPTPAVENDNPASIPRSCPNCGYMAMGSEINSAIEQGETELKCPRCGFSINVAPDEQFLMARKDKMSKLTEAIKKFGQWRENIMDLSDELYYPTAPEMEDPKMNRIRELEGELGLEPMELSDLGLSADEYLAYLEDEAGMWKGRAKKAQRDPKDQFGGGPWTKEKYERYQKTVDENLEGLEHVSSGPCPGCEECGLSEEPSDEEYDLASEPHFSRSPCEACGSRLGGDRYPAHGILDGEIIHFNVCPDCYYYLTYGHLDDMSMMEVEEDKGTEEDLERESTWFSLENEGR